MVPFYPVACLGHMIRFGRRMAVTRQHKVPRQDLAIFLMQDMRRDVLPKFIEICKETPCWCPARWAPTWRPKPTETSVTEFW